MALLPIKGSGSFSNLVNDTGTEVKLLKEYAWDFENDCFLLDDTGNYFIVYGLDALKVRNYHALRLYKGRYFIFDKNGGKLKDFIGKSFEFVQQHAQDYIEEILLDRVYVTSIDELKVTMNGNKALITFKVSSIYGTYEEVKEV